MPTIANTTNYVEPVWLNARHHMIMERLAKNAQTWIRLAADTGNDDQLRWWAHITQTMRIDVGNICLDLLRLVPSSPSVVKNYTAYYTPWRISNRSTDVFASYIGYMGALTQGKLDDELLVTITRQWENGNVLNFDRLRLDEVADTLKRGADVAYLVTHLCGMNAYRRRSKDDVIPHRLVEDFEEYGGLDMVDAINNGIPLNDIVGGVRI